MRRNQMKAVLMAGAIGISSMQAVAQLNPQGGYLMGNQVEVGIHNHGHEGTWDIAGSNSRTNSSTEVYLGFVANPQNDGWVDYDGDFFTPGSPENGFGLEINGVNYSNNGYDPNSFWPPMPQYEIPGSLSNYQQNGDCISVQWDGAINNVAMKIVYSLNITQLYYTTEVTLTNNTGAALSDLYYYRNLDPDNNEELTFEYSTQNTIVSQPTPGCEKALVSATQDQPWFSYIGLAAVGPNFRVAYGGFSNRDASDIWNGVAGLTGTSGSTNWGDEAIALAYKIPNLAAGASETFQFGVILDQNQIDLALASFYYFNYSGGTGSPPTFCVPQVDTVFTCAGNPTTISVEGPNTAGYTWTWSPATDLSTTTGTTTEASPNTTTTYTATGTPVGGCVSSNIQKQIVVDLNAGPEIEITDPGPQCGSFDLSTLVVNDVNNTPGTVTEFYGVIPDSADQVAGIWPTNIMNNGDDVWVMIGDPVTGCFAVEQVIIDFGGSGSAGDDSTVAMCNPAGTTLDLDDYITAATSGVWSETTMPASGQFNTTTAVLNGNGLAGTYTFEYFVAGVGGCADDEAVVTVQFFAQPNADFEYIVNGQSSANGLTSACISNPITFDNNSTVGGGGASITDYDWDYGNTFGSTATNPTYQYPAIGTYTITLTVETNQGCTDTYSMPITITTAPTMAIIIGTPTCNGFSDGSLTVNTAGGGPYIYIISNSAGTQLNTSGTNTVNNIGTGWYYLNVDDGSGCAGIDSVFIPEPAAIDVDLNIYQPLCYGFETGAAIVDTVYNYNGAYTGISYFWSPNPTGQNGLGEDSLMQLPEGSYALTINDANGCSEVFDFQIIYPDSLYFTELGVEPAYCRLFNYQSGNGVVYAAASGQNPNYQYEWENLQTGQTSNNTTWGGLNPGDYQITVINNQGCILTAIVTVDSLSPLADFEMTSPQFTSNYEGTAIVDVHFTNLSQNYANPNDPNADTTFFWNFNTPDAGWIISHDVSETFDSTYAVGGTYPVCLVAVNKNGCTDTLCKDLIIYDPLIFEPVNIFSPDGDGINDVFTFDFRAQAVSEFECVIVNRWGIEVRTFTAITDAWDGTDLQGDKCDDGVYFYTYKGVADNGNTFDGQGSIQLISSGN
jgi:gliding motility-associated-like protein